MSKLQAYLDLYEKMKPLNVYPKLENFIFSRASFAYFVDKYYERPEWVQMLEKINQFISNRDVNELCWFITRNIFDLYIKEIEASASEKEDIILKKNIHALRREAYKQKQCRSLNIVDKKAYPEFFLAHERVINLDNNSGTKEDK